jgi:hypothetical protein
LFYLKNKAARRRPQIVYNRGAFGCANGKFLGCTIKVDKWIARLRVKPLLQRDMHPID